MIIAKKFHFVFALACGLVVTQFAWAQTETTETSRRTETTREETKSRPLSIEDNERTESKTKTTRTTETTTTTTTYHDENYCYREVDDFFNVQEANSQVECGEWEFEAFGGWTTTSDQTDDDVGIAQSIKYGFTDDFFAELKAVQRNLGDGGNQGNGNLHLILFNRFVRESDCMPAIGGQAEMRIPSGDGSSKVDAKFTGIVTKTIVDKLRVHFQGWVMTANGDQGGGSDGERYDFPPRWGRWYGREDGRRHFQWGAGPGIDYAIDDCTLVLLNYTNRSSDQEGNHNLNVIETGVVRLIAEDGDIQHHLKVAFDVGLDHGDETPNWGAKLQWSIDWK